MERLEINSRAGGIVNAVPVGHYDSMAATPSRSHSQYPSGDRRIWERRGYIGYVFSLG